MTKPGHDEAQAVAMCPAVEPLVVCINHPAGFDEAAFLARVAACQRPVELLALPYRENLKLRLARRDPPVDPALFATAPEIDASLRSAYARCEVLMGLDLPAGLLAIAPRLRWVQAFSAGTEHLPVAELVERGIELTTAAGAGAAPIAEFVIGRLLEVWKESRSIERMQRERRFKRPQSRMLAGCTLGIVGLGAIGSAVAERARALGMRVVATRRSYRDGDTSPLVDELFGPSSLARLLEQSDAVVLAAPDTKETRNLIDTGALEHMQPGAVLCNVARGALVDEAALAKALSSGRLGAAILDVTKEEPLPADDPLWEAPNLYLSPHCAVSPDAYEERTLELFAENLRRYAAGQSLLNSTTGLQRD